jgi:RNA polymerase-binding transcription factor DksA
MAARQAAKKAATKKAAAKKAAAKKSPGAAADRTAREGAEYLADEAWVEQQRQTLVVEREQYVRSAESLAAEAASLMADREPGDVQFDEESGEGDTLAVERDRDLALSAAARQSVELIDQALARIEAGTYGVCVIGGDIIPKERLEAIPEAAVCVTHKVQSFA